MHEHGAQFLECENLCLVFKKYVIYIFEMYKSCSQLILKFKPLFHEDSFFKQKKKKKCIRFTNKIYLDPLTSIYTRQYKVSIGKTL